MPQTSPTQQSPVRTQGESQSLPLLDLLFIQDTTASQEPYLESSRNSIMEICHLIEASGRVSKADGIRVGLIAFRDYPPQNSSYDVRNYGFTADFEKMRENLSSLTASGGGDIPEAVEAALNEARNMTWRRRAMKAVILITDAPPHGIGEDEDGFPEGSPKGYDPLQIAQELAMQEIPIYVMACEPTLGKDNDYAVDFYSAIAAITSGAVYPLTQPYLLASAIVGSVLGGIDIKDLSLKYHEEIVRRFTEDKEPLDSIICGIHAELRGKQTKVTTVEVANIYKNSPDASHNMRVFLHADTLASARRELQKIKGLRHIPAYKVASKALNNQHPIACIQYSLTNTGNSIIVFETFQNDVQHMTKTSLQPNHVYRYPVKLNATLNFILECGRKKKTLSRTFSSDQTLDLWQIWEGTQ